MPEADPRALKIAQHVQVRALLIERVFVAAVQHDDRREIRDEADGGHAQEQGTIDVLGNARVSPRTRAESFEFRDTVAKWIEHRGLAYAIVEDLSAVPHEVREEMARKAAEEAKRARRSAQNRQIG